MSPAVSGVAAGILLIGALLAERVVDATVQGLRETADVRRALLIEPEAAIAQVCARRPGPCHLNIQWQDDATGLVDVCAQAPIRDDDPRLRPRRYYEVQLDCPSPVFGMGRLHLATRLAR